VASRLRDAYGFGELAIGERLEGGYANDLFKVVADGAALVLRLKHPPVVEDDVAWEHRLAALLAERLREVPAPVPARDGRTFVALEDTVGWLMPFVDGAPADPAREQHRLEAARALGKVHRAGADLALPGRPRLRPLARLAWPPLVVRPELEDWEATIAEERAWAIAYVAALAGRRLPASLVHGDFFPGNVLMSGDEAVAVVDWEEAQVDWLTWDLANAVGTFCSGAGEDLDRAAGERFVAAYRAAGGTAAPRDDELLEPLVRVKRILEVLRAPTDRRPRWDHQRRNLRSLARLER
jgi:Ser/Thr protein kinase RdoA (MazF antagonist)